MAPIPTASTTFTAAFADERRAAAQLAHAG